MDIDEFNKKNDIIIFVKADLENNPFEKAKIVKENANVYKNKDFILSFVKGDKSRNILKWIRNSSGLLIRKH